MKKVIQLIPLLLLSITLKAQVDKEEVAIASIQLFNDNGNFLDAYNPPIITLGSQSRNTNTNSNLTLAFDQFGDNAEYFIAKIVHCNQDWSSSLFRPIEYLDQYNEFNINNFEFSAGTKVPYIHFEWRVPLVKLTGNYRIEVFKKGEKKPLFQRRFIAVKSTNLITAIIGKNIGKSADTKHRINFTVAYDSKKTLFPRESISATIRQNYRWDNALTNIPPRFVKSTPSILEFDHFSGEIDFGAGNEFRVFDFISFKGGINVSNVVLNNDINHVILHKDWIRSDKTFNQQQIDHNGGFIINTNNGNPIISADYAWVTFNLKMDNPLEKEVYVIGNFCNWKVSDENRMEYLFEENIYTTTILMKQGVYNYNYLTYEPKTGKSSNAEIEGDFRLTENVYDIIVYYRPPGARGDEIIGYKQIKRRN